MANRSDHGGGFVPNGSPAGSYQTTQAQAVYGSQRGYGDDYVPPAQARNNGSTSTAHGGGYVPTQQPPARSIQGSPGPAAQVDSRYVPASYNAMPGPGQAPAYQSQASQNQGYQAQGSIPSQPYGNGTQAYGAAPSYEPASTQQNGSSSRPRDAAVAILRLGEPRGIADTLSGSNSQQRTPQHGYMNISHHLSSWRLKYPNVIQMPQVQFRSTDRRRHRDIMQRVYEGPEDDRYLSPWDGHLAKLVVQTAQDVYDGAPNATWRRTFVRNISPAYIRIANWPFLTVPTKAEDWKEGDWTMVCLKWLPACGALFCMLLVNPNGQQGQSRNGGYYDVFPYKHWGYPKTARNVLENSPDARLNSVIPRVLGPRYLCFLNNPHDKLDGGLTVMKTDNSTANIDYIFIGYSTKQFDNNSNEDMGALHQMAERAAREAGVPAFWVAGSCMPEKSQMEDDVFRISDVMRRAHSLVIIIGPDPSSAQRQSRDELLRGWGTRMWTLPEVLLSPPEKRIKVYTRGYNGPAWEIDKKHFAEVVWNDPLISRQLIEHYSNNLVLSPLELVTIALKCLRSRERGEYLDGDLSYALMGLLRQRPSIDSTDSDFLAFARLSMANDSNLLLERLICLLPQNHNASWLSMDDAWDCSLWDIYPNCQVAGIGPGNTVILDGAYGSAIRWKAFSPVLYNKRASWKRLGAVTMLHGSPLYLIIGAVLATFRSSYQGIGILILVLGLVVLLASPFLVRVVYNGKLWGTEAWFQGFEGYMDLPTIESHLFGAYMGRLKWSTAGSPLSSHQVNQFGECVGVDPMTREDVRQMVEDSKTNGSDSLKVFTLVDTYTLTVTMFAAVRPPVAVLLCGTEGGMQRAIMCSYDWANQTLYRETVLRMETPVLERMSRVHRFRFGLQRPRPDVQSKF